MFWRPEVISSRDVVRVRDAVRGFVFVLARATTRRFVVSPDVVDDGVGRERTARVVFDVAIRAVVAVRAPDVRGTTRRGSDICLVLTTVLIGFNDCDVVTPGFRFVRI